MAGEGDHDVEEIVRKARREREWTDASGATAISWREGPETAEALGAAVEERPAALREEFRRAGAARCLVAVVFAVELPSGAPRQMAARSLADDDPGCW